MAAQTAYGIEADVEGYENAYNPDKMIFMDFRRHHTGERHGPWVGDAALATNSPGMLVTRYVLHVPG